MFPWSLLLVLVWIFSLESVVSAVHIKCSTGSCVSNKTDEGKEATPANLLRRKEERYIPRRAISASTFLPSKIHIRDAIKFKKSPGRKLLQASLQRYATFSNLDAVRNINSNKAIGSLVFVPKTEEHFAILQIVMQSSSVFFKFDGKKLFTKACLPADHSENLQFYIVHPSLPGLVGTLTVNVKETKPKYKNLPLLEAEVLPNVTNQTVFEIAFENEVCLRFGCRIECENHQHPFWVDVERNVQTTSMKLIFGFVYTLKVTCFDSSASHPDINELNVLNTNVTFNLASSVIGSKAASTISSTAKPKPLVAVLPLPQSSSPHATSNTLPVLSLKTTLSIHSSTFGRSTGKESTTVAIHDSLEVNDWYETTSTAYRPSTILKNAGQIIKLDGNITLTSNQKVGELVFKIKPANIYSRVLMVATSSYFEVYDFDVYTTSCLPAWHEESLLFQIVQQNKRAIGPTLNSLVISVLPTVPKIHDPSDNEEVFVTMQRINNLIFSDIMDIELEYSECVSVTCSVYCTNDQFKPFWIAEKQKLDYALGSEGRENIVNNYAEVGSIYKSIDLLKSLNIDVFLKKRNKVLLSFLNGIKDNTGPDQLLAKCVAIEQIYSLSSSSLVAPVCFTKNVLQYQASQSRVYIDVNGMVGPCGSYPTVSSWLATGSTLRTSTLVINIDKSYQLVLTCKEDIMSTIPSEYISKIEFSVTIVTTIPEPTAGPVFTTTLPLSGRTSTVLSARPVASNNTPTNRRPSVASTKGKPNTYLSSFSSRLSSPLTSSRTTATTNNDKEPFVVSNRMSPSSTGQTPLETIHSLALTAAFTVSSQAHKQPTEKSFFDEPINVSLLSLGVALSGIAIVSTVLVAIYKASFKSSVGPQTFRQSGT